MKKIKLTLSNDSNEADKYKMFTINGFPCVFAYPEGDWGSIRLDWSCEHVDNCIDHFRLKEEDKKHLANLLFKYRETGHIDKDVTVVEMPDCEVFNPSADDFVRVVWEEPEFEFDPYVS